ncbi:MAG TPA: sigma-70 family RNA polymerase sigma factor [Chthoniobacteraceae bacterium]|nr:sigma-70 family RNA polymerase sigma factor [Chthoniobacteraceae bacterium]
MPPAQTHFGETRWSLVLAAQSGDEAQLALAELCELYWYPLYAFVRRSGYSREEAEDLTQEYFARLLEKNWLANVDRAKGRFRAFLLATLKHFLANEWRRAQTEKRGGKLELVSLDINQAEERYHREPADSLSPDLLFERRWALTIIENVFTALRAEMEAAGKLNLFETLKDLLSPDARHFSYAEAGVRLGMSEDAVKMTVYRLRKRYRDLLRAHIAATVSTNAEIDQEIRELFRVFSSSAS